LLRQCNVIEPHKSEIVKKYADLEAFTNVVGKFSDANFLALDIFQTPEDRYLASE